VHPHYGTDLIEVSLKEALSFRIAFEGSLRMDKAMMVAGLLLFLAGLSADVYGLGINLQGMMARGATNYTGITFFLLYWSLILLAGLVLAVASARKK
jgi:hypothetical protein